MNLLGYDVDHKQWRQAGMKAILNSTDIGDFTPILAGFQFCIRVLLLEHCLPTDDRNNMSESGMNPVPIFRQVHNEWLVEGEPTPFNYIHKLLNYGLHIGKDTKSRTRVRWSISIILHSAPCMRFFASNFGGASGANCVGT